MRAHQVTLDVADVNLAAPGFQINRSSRRHLNLEVHITYVAAAAVIADDVDYQARLGLARIEMRRRRLHCRGDANLVLRPRFDRDRAGKVFQLQADSLARWKVTRSFLLC